MFTILKNYGIYMVLRGSTVQFWVERNSKKSVPIHVRSFMCSHALFILLFSVRRTEFYLFRARLEFSLGQFVQSVNVDVNP